MTRISQNQLIATVIQGITANRERVAKYSQEISSGIKVANPGDSNLSGSISSFRHTLETIDGYKDRVSTVKSALTFQDDVLKQAEEVLIRASEVATQAANSTNGSQTRANMAAEVFQLRDHMVSLANSTFQGRYIYAGTVDDVPPFSAATYTNPATGPENQRYIYTVANGSQNTRTVNVTDTLTTVVNTPGDQVFANAISALERLGRSLAGYATGPAPAAGLPDGTGNAYTFPTDLALQTQDIAATIDLFNNARKNDVLSERIDLGGRLTRLETADSLLNLTKVNTEDLLNKLQNTDTVESASQLQQAQTALQASFTITRGILDLSILDYI